jgi:hypothetical protein
MPLPPTRHAAIAAAAIADIRERYAPSAMPPCRHSAIIDAAAY